MDQLPFSRRNGFFYPSCIAFRPFFLTVGKAINKSVPNNLRENFPTDPADLALQETGAWFDGILQQCSRAGFGEATILGSVTWLNDLTRRLPGLPY